MKFSDYQQTVVDAIGQALPSLKTVQVHGGSITESEIRRWGAQAPAVFVSTLGVKSAQATFLDQADLVFCAYVIAKNSDKADRHVVALNIVQGLSCLLKSAPWTGCDFVTEPQDVQSENLFNTEIDKIGLSLWATTWQQTVSLGVDDGLAQLNDFLRFAGTAESAEGALIETFGNLNEENP